MFRLTQRKPFLFKKIFLDIWKRHTSYTDIYYNLIMEDYPLFPVPNLLVNKIIQDLQNNRQSIFFIRDIIKKYKYDFNNYRLFLQNLQDLYKLNKYAWIKLRIIDTNKFQAQIEDIDDKFNCYLEVSKQLINKSKDNTTLLFVAIQHEIIHWLQVVLNFYQKTTHGLWKQLYSTDFEHNNFYNFIIKYFVDEDTHISYLFEPKQFEAFCSNACEYLTKYYYQYYSKYDKQQFFNKKFLDILDNFNIFSKLMVLLISRDQLYYFELFSFCKLCQLIKKQNRFENYLKQILLNHLLINNNSK